MDEVDRKARRVKLREGHEGKKETDEKHIFSKLGINQNETRQITD